MFLKASRNVGCAQPHRAFVPNTSLERQKWGRLGELLSSQETEVRTMDSSPFWYFLYLTNQDKQCPVKKSHCLGLIYRDGSFLGSSLTAFLILTPLPIRTRTSQPHVKEGKEGLACTNRSLGNAVLFPSPPSRSGLQGHSTNPGNSDHISRNFHFGRRESLSRQDHCMPHPQKSHF